MCSKEAIVGELHLLDVSRMSVLIGIAVNKERRPSRTMKNNEMATETKFGKRASMMCTVGNLCGDPSPSPVPVDSHLT